MNFGGALEHLKNGCHVSRKGWNGKGMYLYVERFRGQAGLEPCIVIVAADGKIQPGWLASQADMLADDWVLVAKAA